MVVRTLDAKRDPFRSNEDEEEISELEVPYLSAIDTGMVLKIFFRYLKGMTDLGLFYTYESLRGVTVPLGPQVNSRLVSYTNAGYMSDPYRVSSQTGYVFTIRDTATSWRSTKQTLVATSSNHAEILALHEVSCECF
ncbi:secreted RxLR effector protein 161-like [Malus domestica]|uniref:secreted RxLR effector protein 161-like n=1 Tax=Malus domestica TaxID=3750 RepID=UPI00397517E7